MSATPTFLVGEAPSRSSNPESPFSGRSGARLRELLGRELEPTFEVHNLLTIWPGSNGKGSRFDYELARARALTIFQQAAAQGCGLLLVGHRVANSFGLGRFEYLRWEKPLLGVRFAVFPHPSQVNRWWNEPENEARARRFLRRFPTP